MSMVIPPKHREGDLGVISPLELDKRQCKDIIALHKDSQNIHKIARIQSENSNVVNIETADIGEWHDDHILNYKRTATAEWKRLFPSLNIAY